MSPLHFSLIFSGTVSPDGGDAEAENIALTPVELLANLEQAVNTITGNGLVTRRPLSTSIPIACVSPAVSST